MTGVPFSRLFVDFLALSWVALGDLVGPLGPLGPSLAALGRLLGLSLPVLGLSWPLFGLSWPLFSLSGAALGLSWAALGSLLTHLGLLLGLPFSAPGANGRQGSRKVLQERAKGRPRDKKGDTKDAKK